MKSATNNHLYNMGIAGVFRTKRFYTSTDYFVALASGASPMRSIN
ncbi:hypothetical protein HMPREF0666_00641 [Prevotella sp. C561]|nr:hypothetical protein HMPREF0666_00641 [Prevotella sp. C561]